VTAEMRGFRARRTCGAHKKRGRDVSVPASLCRQVSFQGKA
jgi:hypothetical protein